MEVRIDRRFDLPVTPAQAWALLSDIPATATCMPGVTLDGQDGERAWNGGMRARVGPATMNFKGRVELRSMDGPSRRLHMTGKGGDTAGSSAVMDLHAAIEDAQGDAPGTCVLVSVATVAVSGRIAQFGSRLLLPVADTLLRSFVDNFKREAQARAAAQAQAESAGAQSPGAAESPVAAAAPPLRLSTLLWDSLRRWWGGLFRRAE